jgi:hypothetical protein
MTPTAKLRFVEREVFENTDAHGNLLPQRIARTVLRRILQQWWLDHATGDGEWRDVPLEAE